MEENLEELNKRGIDVPVILGGAALTRSYAEGHLRSVYDGPLLDNLADSDIGDYIRTMERLRELPVTVVHGGHDPSFGRARLIEICDEYLAKWRAM